MTQTEAIRIIKSHLNAVYPPEERKQALAALSVLEASVLRKGYVAAPFEPTQEMIDAVLPALLAAEDGHQAYSEIYKAMLAAFGGINGKI